MRVLLTTDTVGGVWTYTRELTEGLLRKSCSIMLVSFGGEASPDQVTWLLSVADRYEGQFAFRQTSIPLEWMEFNNRALSEGESVLRQAAEDFAPDVLHTNQFCYGQSAVPIPRIVVAHSDVLSWAEACAPLGLPSSLWLDRYKDLVQRGLLEADVIVAPTRWMLDALTRNFTLPPSQHVIANGRTLPHEPDEEVRSVQAVTAGRMWDPSKNLGFLKSLSVNLPIFVAGDLGNESSFSSLPRGLTRLGILSEADLLALFRKSRIYIAASIYEPFGLAPLEAALCGCAVIANNIPSFHEVWGDAALYFCTSEELNQQLQHLSEDESFLAGRRQLSRLHAERFSAEAMTDKYLLLYDDLLARKSKADRRKADTSVYVT